MSLIETSIKNRIGTITLNRPEKRNALSPELVEALKSAFSQLEADEEVKIVVLTGRGKAFCAGADLAYLQKLQSFSRADNIEDSRQLSELFKQIYTFPKTVIAKVQGHAIAGGCGLASVCDYIFTVDAAKFGYTEVRIGFVPAIVSYFLIKKIGEAKATRYLMSGALYPAQSFQESGLIESVLENQEKLDDAVEEFAMQMINSNSGQSMALTKGLIGKIGEMNLENAMQYAAEINANARATDDCKKGIGAFLSGETLSW